MNLSKKEYLAIMQKLESIQKDIRLSRVLQGERNSPKPRYPDLLSLETAVKEQNLKCSFLRGSCSNCKVEKRNKCWSIIQKRLLKKKLIAGMPYTKEQLGEMKIAHLWILASHLKVKVLGTTKSELVVNIYRAQPEEQTKGGKKK